MNMKKILPLSFAALSVAGALSACSDTAVTGADVQDNSMAQRSSSSVVPGSSSSIGELDFIPKETLALLKGVSKGVAVTIRFLPGESGAYEKDTVNASEYFDNVVKTILDADSVRLMGADSVYENIMNMPSDENRSTALKEYRLNFQTNNEIEIVMKDAEGLAHGPIGSYYGIVGLPEKARGVVCLRQSEDIVQNGGAWDFRYEIYLNDSDSGVVLEKHLVLSDSAAGEQFKQDCALENGSLDMKNRTEYIFGNTYLELSCSIPLASAEGILTYKDPYWKKYGTRVIESCTTTQSIDDIEY